MGLTTSSNNETVVTDKSVPKLPSVQSENDIKQFIQNNISIKEEILNEAIEKSNFLTVRILVEQFSINVTGYIQRAKEVYQQQLALNREYFERNQERRMSDRDVMAKSVYDYLQNIK